MQARMTKDGDAILVHLAGRVDVETAEPFRKACFSRLIGQKVIFSFRELSFVGSSGIIPFLETLQTFAQTNQFGMKFCYVGSEFKKVLAATPLGAVEMFENEALAVTAYVVSAGGPLTVATIPVVMASETAPTAETKIASVFAALDGSETIGKENSDKVV